MFNCSDLLDADKVDFKFFQLLLIVLIPVCRDYRTAIQRSLRSAVRSNKIRSASRVAKARPEPKKVLSNSVQAAWMKCMVRLFKIDRYLSDAAF